MEEFENFFSQLIPAPDQDIWLLGAAQQPQQSNDGVSVSGIPIGWNFQNLAASANNITAIDNNPHIKEQLLSLQQQQQQQQTQIQHQLQTYQQLQQQQYQQRQQQYQQQYHQPYTTPSPPDQIDYQQLSPPHTSTTATSGTLNTITSNTATPEQQQQALQLQIQQLQQQQHQQHQLQQQQEHFQHQQLQQQQQHHIQQMKQQEQYQQQLKQQQQILHVQQQVQHAQQLHQAQQQAVQQQITSPQTPLQQQAMLQAQSLMNSILNHDIPKHQHQHQQQQTTSIPSQQFLNTPLLDQQILSSIKPSYSQIAKSNILTLPTEITNGSQPNYSGATANGNSSTPHFDDLTGRKSTTTTTTTTTTKGGKQKQPKTPTTPKQPKTPTNKQKKNAAATTSTTNFNDNITTSTQQPPSQQDNLSTTDAFELYDDDDKKKSVNRINQNLASRNYRQRRKEYIKEIENKMAALTFENHQLKKENESLKETGGVEVMRPEPELITMVMEGKQIIIQLSQALKKNDDRSLIYLLHLYHCAIAKRYSIVEKEVEKIVHPYTQSKLAAMGYIPKSDKMFLNCITGPGADSWFQLFKNEAEISIEQSIKLEALRAQHGKIDTALLQERQELDLDIKKFYYTKILVLPNNPLVIGDIPAQPYNGELSQSPTSNSPLEISQLLDFAGKLEALKKNFILHRNLMLDTLSSLSSILTPRQEAMLLVRVHFYTSYDFTHMELLKDVWTNIVSSKTFSGPMNIAEALKKMSDTTNAHPTIENIVKPPQFHQYTPKQQQIKFENQTNNFISPQTASTINNAQASGNNFKMTEFTLNNNITNNTTTALSQPMTLNPPPVEAIPYPSSNIQQAKRFQWFNYPPPN